MRHRNLIPILILVALALGCDYTGDTVIQNPTEPPMPEPEPEAAVITAGFSHNVDVNDITAPYSVRFRDTSTTTPPAIDLTCEWDWGDNSEPEAGVCGDILHRYLNPDCTVENRCEYLVTMTACQADLPSNCDPADGLVTVPSAPGKGGWIESRR